MSNPEFIQNAIGALHFACVVCWLKETGSAVLADNGIIHELVHLVEDSKKDREPDAKPFAPDIARLRMDFNQVLELA